MEILSKLLIISSVFVNTFKNIDGGMAGRIQETSRLIEKLFPYHKPKSQIKFQQQNEYSDYDAGVDANDEDYPLNDYYEPSEKEYSDLIYNRNVPGYNGNIINKQTHCKSGQISNSGQFDSNNFYVNKNIQGCAGTTSEDYNINSNIHRPLGSMDLINAGNVGKATDDGISDRFTDDSTSPVGEKEKVIPEAKILKPLKKTKFFFQVQPVKPVVDEISGINVVYYIE